MALMYLTNATCHRLTECFPASGELSSYWHSVALLMAHRRQRWPNSKPTNYQKVVHITVADVFSPEISTTSEVH